MLRNDSPSLTVLHRRCHPDSSDRLRQGSHRVPMLWKVVGSLLAAPFCIVSTTKGRCLCATLLFSWRSVFHHWPMSFAVDLLGLFEHLRSLYEPIRSLLWTDPIEARICSNVIRASFELPVFKGQPLTYCVSCQSPSLIPWVPCNAVLTFLQMFTGQIAASFIPGDIC